MKRSTLVTLHLGLSALFMPFLLILPLSGGLYLLDIKGEQAKVEAFKIAGPVPGENTDAFFREQFKANNIDFDFEYIRVNNNDFTFRPSSRVHYMATKSEAGATVYKLEPDILRRFMEIHKGHGPKIIRWLETAFALALILVTVSGIYLAVTVPAYRKILGGGFAVGLIIMLLGLL